MTVNKHRNDYDVVSLGSNTRLFGPINGGRTIQKQKKTNTSARIPTFGRHASSSSRSSSVTVRAYGTRRRRASPIDGSPANDRFTAAGQHFRTRAASVRPLTAAGVGPFARLSPQ